MNEVKEKSNKKVKFDLTKLTSFFKKPAVLIIILLLFFILLIFFGTKIYLSIRFLIGDEFFVHLTVDPQEFFLNNSDSAKGEFNVYVSTNLFCKSLCEYELLDLSDNKVIDKGNFDTVISNPYSKKYFFEAPDKGAGQKLYRFEVSCLSKPSNFCKATGELIRKSSLITVNYNLNEDQLFLRNKAIKRLNEFIEEDTKLNILYLENKYLYNILSKKVILQNLTEYEKLFISDKINESIENFRSYEYGLVLDKKINFSEKTFEIENSFLKNEFDKYNNLTSLIKLEEFGLIELTLEKNLSINDFEEISELIKRHNEFANRLSSLINIEDKTLEIEEILLKLNQIKLSLNKLNETNLIFENINLSGVEPLVSNFSADYQTNLSIENEKLICCYNNICEECCDENCANDKTKYPIILLHGHSFNNAISAEKSLSDLRSIQEKLFSDGFLDGGDFILSSEGNLQTFENINKQIVFTGSYYFDIYKNTEKTIILETQSDNLNTYALRLNDIIQEVKLKTNKDRVIIVSHSMGGLVARRYIQIFGEDDVEKLILIGVPNNGIDGKILSGCPIFGAEKHCEDMDEKSLFMNKLIYGNLPKISVKNIIGVGCSMEGENGDGVVKNSSAYLSWANNSYINGTCEGFDFLHQEMLKPEKYPEVYNLIKDFILN